MCICIINIAAPRRQAPEEILCSQVCLFSMSLLRKGDYRALILQNDGLRLGKEKGGGGGRFLCLYLGCGSVLLFQDQPSPCGFQGMPWLVLSLIPFYSHDSKVLGFFPPQGLCTGWPFWLESSPSSLLS